MIQRALLFLITMSIAIAGGTASVWYVLQSQHGIGALTVGGWTAYPDIGTPDADPYSKARVARDGLLTLGRAEGLVFIADTDSSGAPLLQGCDYRIEGSTPSARFWTLFAADRSLVALAGLGGRPPAVQSHQIIRQPDNSFDIAFGPSPAPGNWVPLRGEGPMTFLLTLYDTPVALTSGVGEIELPQVLRVRCDD
jgi:hypothetical protein